MGAPFGIVNDGKRLTPIPLAGKQPVAEFVFDTATAPAVCFEPGDDLGFGRTDGEAVQIAGVHQGAIAGVGLLGDITAGDDFGDRQPELGGELPVTLIMTRHGHDGPGAVTEQDVVGNKDRDLLAVSRIGRIAAQEDAGLGLILLAFQIRLRCDRPPIA